MTGADLHPNAIDGTTGTELTPASQTTYDSRWLRKIGGTVTPTADSATVINITKADGTTSVLDVDTTNARVGVGTNAPTSTVDILATTPALLLRNASAQAGAVNFGSAAHGVARGPAGVNNVSLFTTSGDVYVTASGSGASHLVVKNSGNVGIGNALANSLLHVSGPIATALSNKTAAYTLSATDSTITADATGAAFQVTLPTAASITGRQYTIKRTNATNNVTVGCNGAETIDGATTKTLGTQWASLTAQSNGTNWVITAQMGTVS